MWFVFILNIMNNSWNYSKLRLWIRNMISHWWFVWILSWNYKIWAYELPLILSVKCVWVISNLWNICWNFTLFGIFCLLSLHVLHWLKFLNCWPFLFQYKSFFLVKNWLLYSCLCFFHLISILTLHFCITIFINFNLRGRLLYFL